MIDPENILYWSVVGTAELAVKVSIGKIQLPNSVEAFVNRDPFDRLLLAQALVEELPIISVDSTFRDYEVEVVW